jgi:hypothetical protein
LRKGNGSEYNQGIIFTLMNMNSCCTVYPNFKKKITIQERKRVPCNIVLIITETMPKSCTHTSKQANKKNRLRSIKMRNRNK